MSHAAPSYYTRRVDFCLTGTMYLSAPRPRFRQSKRGCAARVPGVPGRGDVLPRPRRLLGRQQQYKVSVRLGLRRRRRDRGMALHVVSTTRLLLSLCSLALCLMLLCELTASIPFYCERSVVTAPALPFCSDLGVVLRGRCSAGLTYVRPATVGICRHNEWLTVLPLFLCLAPGTRPPPLFLFQPSFLSPPLPALKSIDNPPDQSNDTSTPPATDERFPAVHGQLEQH